MDSPPADQDVQTVIDLELRLLRTPTGWRVYFHQGTLISEPGAR